LARTIFISEGPFTYISPVTEMTGLPVVTEVSAEQYLLYARADLSCEGPRASINALGNAKRCMHLLIDNLLEHYGLLRHYSRVSFPQKLRLLDDVGLISLNVFRRLNIERNTAEHEYTLPNVDQVEDFVDVCQLLLLAIQRLGEVVVCRAVVGLRSTETHELMVLEPALGKLEFFDLADARKHESEALGARIEYVSTRLERGERYPAATVSDDPARSLALTAAERSTWLPFLRELVSLQTGQHGGVSTVHDGVVTIWSSRNLSAELVSNSALGTLLGMNERPDQVVPGEAGSPMPRTHPAPAP
jgi:hypothetical protein